MPFCYHSVSCIQCLETILSHHHWVTDLYGSSVGWLFTWSDHLLCCIVQVDDSWKKSNDSTWEVVKSLVPRENETIADRDWLQMENKTVRGLEQDCSGTKMICGQKNHQTFPNVLLFSQPTLANYLLSQNHCNKTAESVKVKFRWSYLQWKPLYIFFFFWQKGCPDPADSDSLDWQSPFNINY